MFKENPCLFSFVASAERERERRVALAAILRFFLVAVFGVEGGKRLSLADRKEALLEVSVGGRRLSLRVKGPSTTLLF